MKTKILIALLFVGVLSTNAQKSPRQQAEGSVDGVSVSVDYSSPKAKGRTIYGGLVDYGKVWRAGADKNTTISFNKNVTINGKSLKAGKYGFFIIPNKDKKWVAIFNTKNDSWGAYDYKESEDALRVEVKATTSENKESLTFNVTDSGIDFAWADKSFTLEVK